MSDFVTIDGILSYFENAVEKKEPVAPSTYLDGAAKLVILSGNLDDELIAAEMAYNRFKASLLETDGITVAKAEMRAEASNEYETLLHLRAKRKRIDAFIQVQKKRVDLKSWDQ